MNDHNQFEGTPDAGAEYAKLAQLLQDVLKMTPTYRAPTKKSSGGEHEIQLELLLDNNYHIKFFQQLPDFIMALLNNDPHVTLHYAPLLYHLAGCEECHRSYLDLYDSMR